MIELGMVGRGPTYVSALMGCMLLSIVLRLVNLQIFVTLAKCSLASIDAFNTAFLVSTGRLYDTALLDLFSPLDVEYL